MFTRYTNGAEQEVNGVYRYANGAEQEAEAVYRYVNGAEQEVWSAMKWMSLLASNFSASVDAGYATISGYDGKVWSVITFQNVGGYATYYLEGNWTNPTISFDWQGFCNYETSSGATRYASAGSISLYTRSTSGTTEYPSAVTSVGSSSGDGSGTFSTTLTGTFDRIGFKIELKNWGSTSNPLYSIDMWNILIDGKMSLPSEDCVN